MKNVTIKFLLLTILVGSSLIGQSFYNPVWGSDASQGSARAAAMGGTNMVSNNTSSLLIYNPAGLNDPSRCYALDYNFSGEVILERRGYDLKDTFGDYLTTGDYVANRNYYYGHGLGLIYNYQADQFNLAGAFSLTPLTSMNYQYEEEVRGNGNLEDGVIGIRDPLLGFQYLQIEGTLNALSFGGSVSMATGDYRSYSLGFGFHNIMSQDITQQMLVDTVDWDENYLASIVAYDGSFESPDDWFFSFGLNADIIAGMKLAFAYESAAEIIADEETALLAFNAESGLLEYLSTDPTGAVQFDLAGMVYTKPEKVRLGFQYKPRRMVPMEVAVELEKSYTSDLFENLKLDDVTQWKLGFEYHAMDKIPVRAGLIFRNSPLSAIDPESIFTFGTGKSFGRLTVDVAGHYSVRSYKYPDLFPVNGETRPDFDTVTESNFNFTSTLHYTF